MSHWIGNKSIHKTVTEWRNCTQCQDELEHKKQPTVRCQCGEQIPCQHDWDEGESGVGGNRLFTCMKCGRTEMDD